MTDDLAWLKERQGSASKRLQAYINQYENKCRERTPKSGCYVNSGAALLSSRRRAFSREYIQQGEMKDNLVEWVNASYARDLHRKVKPYGQSSSNITSHESVESIDDDNEDEVLSTWSDPGLSTLPSPGSSVATDLDSNIGSESTDKLLKSYYRKQVSSGKSSCPSWVKYISEENYPSWLDDVDRTQHEVSRNGYKRTNSPPFPTRQHISSTTQQNLPAKSIGRDREAWELESVETEVLVTQPIYGHDPVNMGGHLHTKLYRDKKIEKLNEQSFKKIGKKRHKESTPIHNGMLMNSPLRRMKSNTKSTRITPTRPSPNSKAPHSFTRHVTPSQKPSRAMKNLKLSLEERKKSLNSNSTDKLLRRSPSGLFIDETRKNYPSTTTITPRSTNQSPYIHRSPPLRHGRATSEETSGRTFAKDVHQPPMVYRKKSPTGILRQGTRSVPRMRSATVPGNTMLAERLYRMSLTDRGRIPRGWDTDSVNTEKLVDHPPMPIFDASPSLSTETAPSTISAVSGDTLVEQEALKTSLLFDDDITAVTSSGRGDVIDTSREWYQHYNPQSVNRVGNPGIIESFLDDCLRSSQEGTVDSDVGSSVSERNASSRMLDKSEERPVETLKKLLFTVQNLTKSSSENEDVDTNENDHFIRNGVLQTPTSSTTIKPEENNSLSRAYYHLSRLKKLVSVSQEVAASK